MFKREMKTNFKSFLIWTLVLIALFLAVFLVYPSMISNENMQLMDEMIKIFPEELLKAFNMDLANIDTAFGWLKTEGFVFVLLITGVYSGILGSNILLKEENDKTIEYLNSLPITRKKVVLHKISCAFLYILLIILSLGIFNYIGLSLSGEFDRELYLILSITPIFSSIVIFSVCLFISTFTHKTKKTLGLSLGFVFISYFLQIISEMSEKAKILKYFSVYTLADVRNVILNIALNPFVVIISIVLSLSFVLLATKRFQEKDLV